MGDIKELLLCICLIGRNSLGKFIGRLASIGLIAWLFQFLNSVHGSLPLGFSLILDARPRAGVGGTEHLLRRPLGLTAWHDAV